MPSPVTAIIRHEIAYVVRASAIAADEDVRLGDWDRSRSIREPVGVDRAARNRQPAGWCIRLGIGIRYGGRGIGNKPLPPPGRIFCVGIYISFGGWGTVR